MFSNTPFDKLLLKSPISIKEKKPTTYLGFTSKPINIFSTQSKS
jgi:hypothetical protein